MTSKNFVLFVIYFAAQTLPNEIYACFLTNEHQKTVLTAGSSYYQECQCKEPGFSIANLQWLDSHGKPIETGPGTSELVYAEAAEDSINLYIPNISKSMSGEYKCVTEVKGVRYIKSYSIDAYEPLYFFKTPNDQHLILHMNSTISCEARGESFPRISWQRDVRSFSSSSSTEDEFVDILPTPQRYEITPEGLLVINVTKEDAGRYKCTAMVISTGEEVDKFIDVGVQVAPIIKELVSHPSTKLIAGDGLSIQCKAEGDPAPQYSWKKVGSDSGKTTKTWTQNVNTIDFESVHQDDEGDYECVAYNAAGSSTKNISVEVLVPPMVTQFFNITEPEGTIVQLICNATGKPEPNITITYEGWNVGSAWELSEYKVIPHMVFMNLDRSDEGIYVCNASSEVGYDAVPMYLTVLHRPYFKDPDNNKIEWGYDGKTVKLNCAQESNPPATITWRFESNAIPTEDQVEINKRLLEHSNSREQVLTINIDKNTTYGVFYCTARNELGENTKIIHLKEGFRPPLIESEINITEVTATSITFQIKEPSKAGIPEILGYTALYDDKLNYDITNIHLNRTWSVDRPYKLGKLKPNTTYFVSFAAVNEVGAGEFSSQLLVTTLEKSVPEPPVIGEELIQRSSDGNHLLTWKASDDNGEPVDFYVLKYCPVYEALDLDEELCEVRHVESTTEIELPDLEANTTYFLELIAHNAEGNSTPTNISITTPSIEIKYEEPITQLSGGAIIGISIVIVLVCLLLLDVLLLLWRRQGLIATCCCSNKEKKKENTLNSRDKKGLLVIEPMDTRPDNGHREFEYNKTTGIITGKHSSV